MVCGPKYYELSLLTTVIFASPDLIESRRRLVESSALSVSGVEDTVQDLVGHERSTLKGSTYSGKSTFEMWRDALAKLAY